MERIEFTPTEGGWHIEGFPEAVKAIKIDGPKATRLAHIALHRADLSFALECVEGINLVSEQPRVNREALWRSAIIHTMKCFGKNRSRFKLEPKRVYKGNRLALEAFDYFQTLRDKHFVHDENAYSQCLPSAILNKKEATHKIAKIVCTSFQGVTLVQDNYANLQLLISDGLKWLANEFDILCTILTSELEATTYEDLLHREAVTYRAPTLDEIQKPRAD
jgi:hypothetical protein